MDDLKTKLEQAIGERNAKAILDGVFNSYASAYERVKESSPQAQKDTIGYLRRSSIHDNCHQIGLNIPHEAVRYYRGQGSDPWHHLEVELQDYVLVPAYIEQGLNNVLKKGYLKKLVHRYSPNLLDPKGKTVILIAHHPHRVSSSGKNSWVLGYPEKIHVMRIDSSLTISERFNMMEAYPDVVKRNVPKTWNEEAVHDYIEHGIRVSA